MIETPSVSRTCEPTASRGTSIQSRTEGPSEGADPEQEQHPRQPQPIGERLHDEPRRQHDPERQDDVFGVHATGF